MKKLFLLFALILLVGCNQAPQITPSSETEIKNDNTYKINVIEKSAFETIVTDEPLTNEIIELAKSSLPKDSDGRPEGTGGDEAHHLYFIGDYAFDSIPYTLFDLTGKSYDEIYEWLYTFPARPYPLPTSIDEYLNVRTFINHYNIPLEEAKEALIKGGRSEEEAEIIVYGSDNEILNRFNLGYSIVIGDKYYSVSWLLDESPEKWKEVGITPEMLEEKFDLYASRFTTMYKEMLNAKLSVYFGSKVQLKTIKEIVDENFTLTVGEKTYTITQMQNTYIDHLRNSGITAEMLEELQSKMVGYETSPQYDYLNGIILMLDTKQTVFGKDEPDAELPIVPNTPAVTE